MRYTRLLIGTLVTVGLLAGLVVSPASAQPGFNPPGLAQAIAAQERHTDALLAREGVVGTAVGLNPAGKPVVQVFTEREGVPGIPSSLDRVPVVVRVTGEFVAENHATGEFPRPVPIGVSSSNEFSIDFPFVLSGTLGARLVDDQGDNDPANDVYFALSNNHIFANENESSGAVIDSPVIQPGRADGGSATADPTDIIGTLSAYVPIEFNRRASNLVDAAIAEVGIDDVGTSTPEFLADGATDDPARYEPSTGNLECADDDCFNLLGVLVKKYGRTTELTHGVISGVNAITIIRYDSGRTRFVDQLIIDPVGPTEDFSAGGDSGSLVVTEVGENPVGLHFAGGDIVGIANRIDLVFDELANDINDDSTLVGPVVVGLRVDGKAPVPPTPGITVNPTSGLVTTEAGGQDTFDVVLDTLPSADVTISLSSSDITEGTVSPSSLTFTSTDGTTAQTVTVTGVEDDGAVDGDIAYDIITKAAVSNDLHYRDVNPFDVSVTNTDNDAAAGGTGTVQGRVTNSATGQKISGATVEVGPDGPSDTTNNGGKYSMAGVPGGLQVITASATGCSETVQVDVVVNGSVKQDFALVGCD